MASDAERLQELDRMRANAYRRLREVRTEIEMKAQAGLVGSMLLREEASVLKLIAELDEAIKIESGRE